MKGPGKYDRECDRVQAETRADAVCLLVLGGDRGHGFSMNLRLAAHIPEALSEIAHALRNVASQMEQDAERLAGQS